MNRVRRILWGVVLVALGVLFGLHVMEIVDLKTLFEGWWTLFILVPSFVGLITDRDKIWSIIGLFTGTTLLLACQDIIPDKAVIKLIVPFVIILIGIKMIFKDTFSKGAKEAKRKLKESGEPVKQYAAVFSGQDVNYSGEIFKSAQVNAIFGGVQFDLSNAVIADGAVLDICSVFGGIDIILPPDVNVKINTSSVFGGIDDKRTTKPVNGAVTLYITGSCIFGGADIK